MLDPILLASAAGSTALCIWRFVGWGAETYNFMVWNLWLAWIPFALSVWIADWSRRRRGKRFVLVCVAVLWLLFYPNTLYILTDLIHLTPRDGVPLIFDVAMLTSFVWNGLFLGFLSLYLVQHMIKRFWGTVASWIGVTGILLLTNIGIYLGRFLRWNSWDILVSPLAIIVDAWRLVVYPSLSIWLALSGATLFFLFLYFLTVRALDLHTDISV